MAGRKKAPLWRQAFLRAMKRTGNVRASAFEAGVDPGTAYDHRAKDPGFAGKWAEAKAAFRAMAAKKGAARGPLHHPPRPGEELVLRRTKHGDQLVRASPGRWSARIEEGFLDALEHTGCVETAAASVGMSPNSFYKRRDKYPEFRARWEERLARNGEKLPDMLNAAAVASLAPALPGAKRRGRARLPQMSVDHAIRLKIANDNAEAKARGARRGGEQPCKPEPTREELEQTLVKLLGMMKKRRAAGRLAAGWTQGAGGIWVPPGFELRRKPEDGQGHEKGDGS